jgi:hypothetical protein
MLSKRTSDTRVLDLTLALTVAAISYHRDRMRAFLNVMKMSCRYTQYGGVAVIANMSFSEGRSFPYLETRLSRAFLPSKI